MATRIISSKWRCKDYQHGAMKLTVRPSHLVLLFVALHRLKRVVPVPLDSLVNGQQEEVQTIAVQQEGEWETMEPTALLEG